MPFIARARSCQSCSASLAYAAVGAVICFRCEDIDPEFQLLETLIAMGYGDVPREKLPEHVIREAERHPQRLALTQKPKPVTFLSRLLAEYPTCPVCGADRPRVLWRHPRKTGELIRGFRCTQCGRKFSREMAA